MHWKGWNGVMESLREWKLSNYHQVSMANRRYYLLQNLALIIIIDQANKY